MARHRKLLGEVNLLGLQAFGDNMSPLWGTIIGGGVAGVTSVTLGHVAGGKMAKNRELYGLLAGLGSAGIMFAMPSTKKAAFGAVVGALLGSGLNWLEKALLGTVAMPAPLVAPAVDAAEAGVAGPLGMARIHALNGLGLRRQPGGHYLNGLGITKVSALNGGLGITTIARQPQSVGTIPGVAGPSFAGTQLGRRAPVNLLGGASARSNQVSLLGGPQIHGLSAAYGATLLGGAR
jgi:hypothetical protein